MRGGSLRGHGGWGGRLLLPRESEVLVRKGRAPSLAAALLQASARTAALGWDLPFQWPSLRVLLEQPSAGCRCRPPPFFLEGFVTLHWGCLPRELWGLPHPFPWGLPWPPLPSPLPLPRMLHAAEAPPLGERGGGRKRCLLPGEVPGGAWNGHQAAGHGGGQDPAEAHCQGGPEGLRAGERRHCPGEALHR